MKQKQELEFQSNQCKSRLERAEKLTVGLADEQIRWKESELKLKGDIEALVGDVFVAAGFISYASPFTGDFRTELIQRWLQKMDETTIPHSKDYSVINVIGDPLEIKHWNACGLPTDAVSIESAIVTTKAARFV